MSYVSTRGDLETNFSECVLWGLTPKGGLLIPKEFPNYSKYDLEKMKNMSYQELAFYIIKDFVDDLPLKDLKKIIEKSYNSEIFRSEEITPVRKIDEEIYLLDLFKGPTLAFKDLALQFLGNLFDYILGKMNSTTNIITATSGDTGSAAIYSVLGKKNLRIFVLTPEGRMSKFQTAQMYSVMDKNVFNIAIDGTFDDCQNMVKALGEDKEFRDKYHLGYMNSINWARILAQIVYYAKGIFEVQKINGFPIDKKIDVAVPTGNFGNVLAGYYAKKIGIPIRKLIIATNENDVLDHFFKTGKYKIRKKEEVISTNSPSMDITSASNFERFIYDLVSKDSEEVIRLWKEITERREFDLSQNKQFKKIEEILSGSTNKGERKEIIKFIFNASGEVIDPHTANAVHLAKKYKTYDTPVLCLATASPLKFEETINEALPDVKLERPKEYKDLEKKKQEFIGMKSGDLESLKEFIAGNALTD